MSEPSQLNVNIESETKHCDKIEDGQCSSSVQCPSHSHGSSTSPSAIPTLNQPSTLDDFPGILTDCVQQEVKPPRPLRNPKPSKHINDEYISRVKHNHNTNRHHTTNHNTDFRSDTQPEDITTMTTTMTTTTKPVISQSAHHSHSSHNSHLSLYDDGLYNTIDEDNDVLCNPSSWIYDIKYMTFSGCGVKGYAYVGSILALDHAFLKRNKNLYSQLKGVSGTSIGAMFALLIVLGVRGRRLMQEIINNDISHTLKDIRIDNLMDMYGLNSSMTFRQQVYDILEKHVGKGDITFKELYNLTHKYYVCCVTNVSMCRTEYHSYLSTPNFKVFESVTASMAIPMLFVPIIINGHYYVDGGLSDNCPFHVFPPDENFIINASGETPDLSTLQNYVLRLSYISLNTLNDTRARFLEPDHQKRKLTVMVSNVHMLEFNISMETKKELLLAGLKQMERFLNPNVVLKDYMTIVTKLLLYQILERSKAGTVQSVN